MTVPSQDEEARTQEMEQSEQIRVIRKVEQLQWMEQSQQIRASQQVKQSQQIEKPHQVEKSRQIAQAPQIERARQDSRTRQTRDDGNGPRDEAAEQTGMDLHALTDLDALYRNYRAYAFSIAYRMLGVVSDAEDVVQDWFMEMQSRDLTEIRDVKAYLARGITNRSLNVLKSARKQREVYVGEWLPEPLVADYESPEQTLERQDVISYAYLVMLERLAPMERAVYLLREVFQYDYSAISEMLGKSESNCRKICSRAKQRLKAGGVETDKPAAPGQEAARKLIERFIAAFERYQVEEMLELLAEDAVLITDGGGYTRSAIFPIISRGRVLALLTSPKAFKELRSWEAVLTEVNGELNLVFKKDGQLKGILCFQWTGEANGIQNLYLLLNPQKLSHLQTIRHE